MSISPPQNNKAKKFTHKGKAYAGASPGSAPGGGGPTLIVNSHALLHAAKKNDYERVKILFRYGYRLERISDKITGELVLFTGLIISYGLFFVLKIPLNASSCSRPSPPPPTSSRPWRT